MNYYNESYSVLENFLISKSNLSPDELKEYLIKFSMCLAEFNKFYEVKIIKDSNDEYVKLKNLVELRFAHAHIFASRGLDVPYFDPVDGISDITNESTSLQMAMSRIGVLFAGSERLQQTEKSNLLDEESIKVYESILMIQYGNFLAYLVKDDLPSDVLSRQMIAMKTAKDANPLFEKILYVKNLFE